MMNPIGNQSKKSDGDLLGPNSMCPHMCGTGDKLHNEVEVFTVGNSLKKVRKIKFLLERQLASWPFVAPVCRVKNMQPPTRPRRR